MIITTPDGYRYTARAGSVVIRVERLVQGVWHLDTPIDAPTHVTAESVLRAVGRS